ncbi:MAG: hypothetical protein AB7F79_00800 [Steroidobacteraceae bacterium]
MNVRWPLLVVTLALSVSGCGTADHAADQQSVMQQNSDVVAPLIDDLNKARAVQDTLQQGLNNTNAAIDAAEHPSE